MSANRFDNKRNGFSRMYIYTAMLHIAYACLFLLTESKFLVLYNVVATLFYIGLSLLITRTKAVKPVFLSCFMEIILFSMIGTFCFGPEAGFGYILFGTVSIAFYILYMSEMGKDFAIKISIIIISIIFLECILSLQDPVSKIEVSRFVWITMFFMNLACGSFLLVSFLLSFVSIIWDDQKELKAKNRNLKDAANYDELTKLLNRRAYDNYMDLAFKNATDSGTDFSVIMFDIDDFKKINDTYGHDVGDAVLKSVADMLTRNVRSSDVVFRWGGEEMMILVSGGSEFAKITAERCRLAVESMEVEANGLSIKVTVTAGTSSYRPGTTRDSLVKEADEALYHGKNTGKNKVTQARVSE